MRFPPHTSLACTKLAKPAQPVCPQRPESRSTRYELGVILPLLSTAHMSVHGAAWGSLFFLFSRPRSAMRTGHVTATMGRNDKMPEKGVARRKGRQLAGESVMDEGAGGSCSCCVHYWDAERGERWGAASVSCAITTPRMLTSAGPLWKRLYRHWGVDLQVMVMTTD